MYSIERGDRKGGGEREGEGMVGRGLREGEGDAADKRWLLSHWEMNTCNSPTI